MRFYCLIIALLFLYSCNSDTETDHVPKRPKELSPTAQWYGGLDGGNWFLIDRHEKENNKEYRIRNFFEDGTKQWDAIFIIKDSGFDITKSYEFIDMSDYSRCTIEQSDKKYIFLFKKDY